MITGNLRKWNIWSMRLFWKYFGEKFKIPFNSVANMVIEFQSRRKKVVFEWECAFSFSWYYRSIGIALTIIWEFVEYIYRNNEPLNLKTTSSDILAYQQMRSILKANSNFNLRLVILQNNFSKSLQVINRKVIKLCKYFVIFFILYIRSFC